MEGMVCVRFLEPAVTAARRHGRDFDRKPLTDAEARAVRVLEREGYSAAQAGRWLAGESRLDRPELAAAMARYVQATDRAIAAGDPP